MDDSVQSRHTIMASIEVRNPNKRRTGATSELGML
jgi:hypothetical protein